MNIAIRFVSPIVVGLLLISHAGAVDITGSSITHNFNAPGPINADLDSVPPGETLSDWTVWNTDVMSSNELNGGPANISSLVIDWLNGPILPGTLKNYESWSLMYTNALNANPPSGSNFGYGSESATPFDTGTVEIDITPNVAMGSSGTIRVFGETDNGGFFGGMSAVNTITVDVDGSPDSDSDQNWSMTTAGEVRDSWMYEMTFTDYNGETFNFQISTVFGVQNPRLNIAAVQISVAEPAEEPVLPDSFKLADGVLVSGTLADLLASDDMYFEVDPSPTKNLLKQRIDLIVQTTSPTMAPNTFNFRVESAMMGGPPGDVIQTVELFNYVTNTRELVDSRAVQNTDESVEVVPGGDLSRFVNQLNGEITAIVIWKSESFAGGQFTWSIDVDETVWLVD